jgi:flagellar basal-body rod modification protein FlgD
MNISPFSLASIAQQPAATDPSSSSTPTTPSVGLASEETFLQLLVAQIKNQDPTSPTDGTQFLTQLAQFSQLEQLINIRQDLDAKTAAPTQPTGNATQPVN